MQNHVCSTLGPAIGDVISSAPDWPELAGICLSGKPTRWRLSLHWRHWRFALQPYIARNGPLNFYGSQPYYAQNSVIPRCRCGQVSNLRMHLAIFFLLVDAQSVGNAFLTYIRLNPA
jgi:hypothetical protein